MQKTINRKDYYGGALMVLIGLGAIYGGSDYHIGTLSHMGPGFFPPRCGLLALTGVLIAVSARSGQASEPAPGEAHSHSLPDLRGSVCILLGILAFLGLGHYGGLLPATFAIVFISRWATATTRSSRPWCSRWACPWSRSWSSGGRCNCSCRSFAGVDAP